MDNVFKFTGGYTSPADIIDKVTEVIDNAESILVVMKDRDDVLHLSASSQNYSDIAFKAFHALMTAYFYSSDEMDNHEVE